MKMFGMVLSVISCLILSCAAHSADYSNKKPNIIWLVIEDISNDLGTYGNGVIYTPNLDKLSAQGMTYTNAFATSPVCSPARSAFFTGMYQTSIGAHHHRSHVSDGYLLPKPVKILTEYLRTAGYYSLLMGPKQKTDFNFHVEIPAFDATDGELSNPNGAYTHGPIGEKILNKRAWQQYKKEGKDKPFFAQINYSEAHRTFIKDEARPINPRDVKIPSYYPDHHVTRQDWALYLETIQVLDQKIGRLFEELEAANALDNTIVFIFGDHGRAMLRAKQWLYDSGIQVPLIVWQQNQAQAKANGIIAGTRSNELVSLIDLMPTTMSYAGITVPDYLQGQVFLGKHKKKRDYIYAQRDRLGATEDRIRAIRDKHFKYILNYYPNLPYTNFSGYKKLQYPVLALMEVLHKQNKLTPQQAQWFTPTRPAEELYDIIADPEEINNLAANPKYKKVLARMYQQLKTWEKTTHDLGNELEDPREAARLDEAEVLRYNSIMEERGLSADISPEDYLVWWQQFLTKQGE